MQDDLQGFLSLALANPNDHFYVYYGLKAAPFTLAHEEIIQTCAAKCNLKNIEICIGVADSPYKDEFRTMWMVTDYVQTQVKAKNVSVVDQAGWTGLYHWLKDNQYKPKHTLVVVGQDEWNHLEAEDGVWKDVKDFKRDYFFTCMRLRLDNVSSSKIRDIFYRDPDVDYFYVKDFMSRWAFDWIKERGYYWQNESTYRAAENNFIKQYDAGKFPRPSVTVDNIVWLENAGVRKVLLIRRGGMPYYNYWALPGGFLDVNDDISIEAAATRELMEETHIDYRYERQDQFRTYADMGVDPRTRVVDVVFSKEISMKDVSTVLADDDAQEAYFFDIDKLPRMAFNHEQIINEFFASR